MTDTPDPTVAVARDLRELETLSQAIPDEVAHRGPVPHLMACLGPVANLEAWGHIIDARDDRRLDTSHVDDHDPDWEPPAQTLAFWTEQLRVEHNAETDLRPSIATEAEFLRGMLGWAYDNEPRWADLVRDVAVARRRLEAQLRAGEQIERGVPCMYDECGGARLTRRLERVGRRWDWTWWTCPRRPREHQWDRDAYARMVTAAHQAASFEDIYGESWCTVAYAARDLNRSVKTIRTWVNEGHVRRACILAGKRVMVSLADVRAQHAHAKRRRRSAA